MYKMGDEWTDERMDDFRDEVYRRYRFDGINSRFVGLYRAQFLVGGGIVAALIGVDPFAPSLRSVCARPALRV